MHDRLTIDEAPDVGIETAELLLHLQEFFCVVNCRGDLCLVANDAVVFQQRLVLTFAVTRNFRRVEAGESLAICVSFAQDRIPAQSRLRSLQSQELEDRLVIVHRYAPFQVMVNDVIGLAWIHPRTSFSVFRDLSCHF